MALQGDLESFALPDVLRLLAGTSKSGRLVIEGPTASGEVDLRDGKVVGGSTDAAARATDPADVVYELLRLESGSFDFDDSVPPASGDGSAVDQVLAAAQQLVAEWEEVEKVVPSVDSWATLRPELEAEEVAISASQWRMVAALGAGSSVRALGERFDITDLAACQEVRSLVEGGLVAVGDAVPRAELETPPAELDESVPEVAQVEDLGLLAAEDGPVVIETRDDALLPEPLPGEGTSFAGDIDEMTSVDGRAFDPIDPAPQDPAGPAPEDLPAPEPAAAVEDISLGEPAGDDIWSSTDSVDPDADPITDETWAKAGWDDNPPIDHLSQAEAGKGGKGDGNDKNVEDSEADGDRGSLMKFLSSVKN